ncbi:hypothetical protein ACOME3_009855 [Neoechinorhynchus agilis]
MRRANRRICPKRKNIRSSINTFRVSNALRTRKKPSSAFLRSCVYGKSRHRGARLPLYQKITITAADLAVVVVADRLIGDVRNFALRLFVPFSLVWNVLSMFERFRLPLYRLLSQTSGKSERLHLLAEEIASLSMIDACELSTLLSQRLKLPEQWLVQQQTIQAATMSANENQDDDDGPKEQKTSFTLHLKRFEGDKKVAIIKEVKRIAPDMNLVQAKKFVESLPHVLKDNIGKDEAEEIVKRLEPLGGVCSIE